MLSPPSKLLKLEWSWGAQTQQRKGIPTRTCGTANQTWDSSVPCKGQRVWPALSFLDCPLPRPRETRPSFQNSSEWPYHWCPDSLFSLPAAAKLNYFKQNKQHVKKEKVERIKNCHYLLQLAYGHNYFSKKEWENRIRQKYLEVKVQIVKIKNLRP